MLEEEIDIESELQKIKEEIPQEVKDFLNRNTINRLLQLEEKEESSKLHSDSRLSIEEEKELTQLRVKEIIARRFSKTLDTILQRLRRIR